MALHAENVFLLMVNGQIESLEVGIDCCYCKNFKLTTFTLFVIIFSFLNMMIFTAGFNTHLVKIGMWPQYVILV